MCLLELIFRLPNTQANENNAGGEVNAVNGRILTFQQISDFCSVPLPQVEWLLMKSLSLQVIKGTIDQGRTG